MRKKSPKKPLMGKHNGRKVTMSNRTGQVLIFSVVTEAVVGFLGAVYMKFYKLHLGIKTTPQTHPIPASI